MKSYFLNVIMLDYNNFIHIQYHYRFLYNTCSITVIEIEESEKFRTTTLPTILSILRATANTDASEHPPDTNIAS